MRISNLASRATLGLDQLFMSISNQYVWSFLCHLWRNMVVSCFLQSELEYWMGSSPFPCEEVLYISVFPSLSVWIFVCCFLTLSFDNLFWIPCLLRIWKTNPFSNQQSSLQPLNKKSYHALWQRDFTIATDRSSQFAFYNWRGREPIFDWQCW
jgi:hypothetical protein